MDINMMNFKNGKDDYLMMMSAPDHAALSVPIHKYLNLQNPKDTSDSSYLHMNPGCSSYESKIFRPKSQDHSNIEVLSPILASENRDRFVSHTEKRRRSI